MIKIRMITRMKILAVGFFLLCSPLMANKSSVRIVAPETATMGQEIVIELHVHHEGNSFLHYTSRVIMSIDGREVQRWSYSPWSRPAAENFIITVRHIVRGPVALSAQAFCNVHGSADISRASVAIR